MLNANALTIGLLSSLALGRALAQHQLPVAVSQDRSFVKAITPEIKQLARDVLRNGSVPGMAIGVVHSNGVVELEPFGKRTEDGASMATDTLFNIASCSKEFLAASLGILMDDFQNSRNVTPLPDGISQFHWYTKVKDILPDDWQLMDEWATEKATFRDILSHQSGIPRHDLSYTGEESGLEIIRRMRYLRPAFELRQRWHYTNIMYTLGAHVISRYSGMSYPDFAKTRIFTPLNMSSTTFSMKQASKHGLLTQSWTKTGRRIPFWTPEETLDVIAGPGGVISSVADMTKWIAALLNGGRDLATNITIIPKETYDLATSAQSVVISRAPWPEFSFLGYGFGLMTMSYQGHEILTHNGGLAGFSAEVFVLPADGIAIVALANADEKHDQELAVVYRIIEDYLKLDHKASVRYAARSPGVETPSDRDQGTHETAIPLQGDSLSLQDYTGTYKNSGYPTIVLCDPKTSGDIPECKSVIYNFSLVEDIHTPNDTLYCAFPSMWISHARLRRVRGNLFDVSATYIFPEGYGADKTPFGTSETGQADAQARFFVEGGVVKGFAMNGLVGEVTERQRIGGSIEDTAEIWFVKS